VAQYYKLLFRKRAKCDTLVDPSLPHLLFSDTVVTAPPLSVTYYLMAPKERHLRHKLAFIFFIRLKRESIQNLQ